MGILSTITTQIATDLANNINRAITPTKLRGVFNAIINALREVQTVTIPAPEAEDKTVTAVITKISTVIKFDRMADTDFTLNLDVSACSEGDELIIYIDSDGDHANHTITWGTGFQMMGCGDLQTTFSTRPYLSAFHLKFCKDRFISFDNC